MTGAWDTSVLSRVHPRSPAFDYVIGRVLEGLPIRVAAPAILEIVYGYQLRIPDDRRFANLLAWFTNVTAGDAFTVVPFDERSAVVAGRMRALTPHAPGGRRDARSKTMRQAAWLLDIQIAATAFAAGLDVVTENRSDFETLAAVLGDLYPDAPPLAVLDAPSWN